MYFSPKVLTSIARNVRKLEIRYRRHQRSSCRPSVIQGDRLLPSQAQQTGRHTADLRGCLLSAFNLSTALPKQCVETCTVERLCEYVGLPVNVCLAHVASFATSYSPDAAAEAWAHMIYGIGVASNYPGSEALSAISGHDIERASKELKLTPEGTKAMRVGLLRSDNIYGVPMFDGDECLCGIAVKNSDGTFSPHENSRCGAFLPANHRRRTSGPLYICSGPRETEAMIMSGRRAIGTHNKQSGVLDLGLLLSTIPGDLILVANNIDADHDMYEMRFLADTLGRHLNRMISVYTPPAGHGTASEFLISSTARSQGCPEGTPQLVGASTN